MSNEKSHRSGGNRRASADELTGLTAEIIPLLRDGLIVMRTLLDVAIARLDEIEEGRVAHVRRETYEAILEVLEAEIERLRVQEPTDAVEAQLDALRSVQAVLDRKLRESTASGSRPERNGGEKAPRGTEPPRPKKGPSARSRPPAGGTSRSSRHVDID